MNKPLLTLATVLTLLGTNSCSDSKTNELSSPTNKIAYVEKTDSIKVSTPTEEGKSITDFVPEGYTLFEKVYGDLNKDGLDDCVIIIKATRKDQFVKTEDRGIVDLNKRGLIVLLNKNDRYELVSKNYDCFETDESEDNVEATYLSIEVERGNLNIFLGFGMWGGTEFNFRLQNSDFELIGYDSEDKDGPTINKGVSINLLTKKKITKENINENPDILEGEEILKKP